MSSVTEGTKSEGSTTLSQKKLYEFSFSGEDFQYIRNLIYQVAGISLTPSKKDLVYSRLARRLRAKKISSFSDYIAILQSGDPQEREEFTNALTTNMTSFFREPHHFQILAKFFGGEDRGKQLKIWTCAASSGEEPYSIAMTAVEHYKSFTTPVKILATDIDTRILAKGKLGLYTLEQLQTLSAEQIKRYFLKGYGKNEGLAKIRPELQRMVAFKHFNLLDECWPTKEKFDAVFCRNVMIYFDKVTQRQILTKMCECLHPHGLFFAGHSENFHHATDLFKVCGKTVYTPRN